ncbi:MAG: hypothetical protein ABW022_11020 [Actinoplanes sp.]
MDEAEKAAESAIEAMTRVAYAALPERAAEELVNGLRAAAESGLKSDAARKRRELSERVYRLRALHEGKIEQLIREGLVANLSAKELAGTVHNYVSPTTPGGASYAALRLARTEINNAFHERQLQGAKRPGVSAVKWNLSGSHRVPDLCNVYAGHAGNGHWPPDEVPDKPHPQCFCYLTYVTMPPEEFRAELAKGSFDDEIERRTRENMARLGQSVGNLTPSVVDPPKEPKARVVNVLPRFESVFAQPWQRIEDPEQRVGSMWSGSFFTMQAIRQAMRNRRAGKPLLEGTPLSRGRFDVFRDRIDEDDPDSKQMYSESDFEVDVDNASRLIEYKLQTAPKSRKALYRGIRLDVAKMFKVGERFSSDIASWTENRDWATVYSLTEDESTGHIGDAAVIVKLAGEKHSVNIDGIVDAGQRGSKEHLARGEYEVVKVTGRGKKYTVEVREVGRNDPPSS